MNATFTQRQLFGGAIIIDLPSDLVDASKFRQVPDTQEVFLSSVSDTSYIVELLQRVDKDDSRAAAKLHFISIADDNGDDNPIINDITVPHEQPPSPPDTPIPIILDGTQHVAKFNETRKDEVRIFLALYRVTELKEKQDIVLTLNVPASAEQSFQDVRETFERIARSLKVVDFGLFVNVDEEDAMEG